MLGMGWFPATLGGLDRYYRSLLEHLPEASGVVIGPAGDAPPSVRVVARQDSPLHKRLLSYWLAARRASKSAEVVDSHFALYAAAPLLSGSLRGRPKVFHFQGPWAQENVAAGDGSRVRFVLRRALERRVLRGADAHIVLSSAFRRVIVEAYRVAPWDVNVWAPGVALGVFTPGDRSQARARLGLDPEAFVTVCVRRLVPRMGVGSLIDAWARIADELPASSVLLIVGEGPLRTDLAERVAQLGLSTGVRMLGRVSDEELLDVYRAADVAAVPTVAFEGYGLVVLEAAACGTPSIVSNVGGLPEATTPLDRSLVVAPGDTEALGERIKAASRGALPSRAATRAYAERFAWPAVAERHRDLYRRLIAGERDKRPRVVYLDHVARLSGGEIALLRVLPHLRHINAHVILGEEGPLADRLAQAGVSVEVLPIAASLRDLRRESVRVGGASPVAVWQTLTYVARLARRLRRLRPDIVHTNSLKAGVYGTLAARALGIPVVWHVRDRISADYIPRPAVRLIRALVRLADGLVANSTATLETVSSASRDSPSWVISDSVELSPYAREADGGATTFGMLGRIAPWKGQDLFLRAFASAFPDGEERAVVVGAPMFGEEDYELELHELVSRLGLTGRVEFRGFRENIWRELARFDVLVHASVIPEPFGQVVLEGMAAGLAVLAPDEGGPAAVIADGETGQLFRSRDADSLAAAMRALSDDGAGRERLGASAQGAIEPYRPDAVASRLEQVYERVLRRQARD
ncbi:MAG: glycosyltransferase [Solirubrobacterales bacterium]|jgi:glycosyltransferase involved in cell wall biosynthesis|nr:glycosyltransferase [Solirubrobacterales bacterium]